MVAFPRQQRAPVGRPAPTRPTARRARGACAFTLTLALGHALSPGAFGVAPAQAADPAASEASPAAMRRAAALATEAKALFQNGVYLEAARLFLEAFSISRKAPLVFNAARAYEEAGQLKRAESLFLLYLSQADTDDAGRADAQARLDALRLRLRAADGAATPAQPAKPEPGPLGPVQPAPHVRAPAPPTASAAPRWPLIAAGSSLVIAGGLYAAALQQAYDLDIAAVRDVASHDAYRAQRDRAQLLRWGAAGAAAVAGGFVAVAVVQRLRGGGGSGAAASPAAAALGLTPTAGGGVALWAHLGF